MPSMPGRIIQFGTSRFLQAHADLFVHEARLAGQSIGPITVVKTTAGDERHGRVSAFGQASGIPVRIRGRQDGQLIDRTVHVHSVDRALAAQSDWPAIVDCFSHDAQIALSNTGDQGYQLLGDDQRPGPPPSGVPASFPGKLLLLLSARYRAGAQPLLFLPCELILSNGQVLRQCLDTLIAAWRDDARFGDPRFRDWLDHRVVIADTLVDRIVSQALEPIGAVAEPYALWAIRKGEFVPPFTHPDVVYTDDLEPYQRLKLHILNLGHTVLADIWQRDHRPPDETVAGILADPAIAGDLASLYALEVVPGFAAHGMAAVASRYVETTMERFLNPYLDHRLSDIAQNHAVKIERRIASFLDWSQSRDAALQGPRLHALAQSVKAAHQAGAN